MQIEDYARENAIDLMAMSTHGRSGISRRVFGSITEKALYAGRDAAVPIASAGI